MLPMTMLGVWETNCYPTPDWLSFNYLGNVFFRGTDWAQSFCRKWGEETSSRMTGLGEGVLRGNLLNTIILLCCKLSGGKQWLGGMCYVRSAGNRRGFCSPWEALHLISPQPSRVATNRSIRHCSCMTNPGTVPQLGFENLRSPDLLWNS
jgi:hypothetical protein